MMRTNLCVASATTTRGDGAGRARRVISNSPLGLTATTSDNHDATATPRAMCARD